MKKDKTTTTTTKNLKSYHYIHAHPFLKIAGVIVFASKSKDWMHADIHFSALGFPRTHEQSVGVQTNTAATTSSSKAERKKKKRKDDSIHWQERPFIFYSLEKEIVMSVLPRYIIHIHTRCLWRPLCLNCIENVAISPLTRWFSL